jgi:N-acetylglucosamine-6-phosphate deacetylase
VSLFALTGGRVLGAAALLDGHAVVVDGERVAAVVPDRDVPRGAERVDVAGRVVAPGFVDVQVNGGGDVLLNDRPEPEAVAHVARAHAALGSTTILPTFITGTRELTLRARAAVDACLRDGVPGVGGVHFEGPFLNPRRAGVHDPSLMRRFDAGDLEWIAGGDGAATLLTVAPERVDSATIGELAGRGVVLSAGHTAGTYEQVVAGFEAGIRGATHLFNAMTPLESRRPGAVGAALDAADVWCGIIADGLHVDFASLRIAWRAKPRGRIVLVTDAMPPVGGSAAPFSIGPLTVEVRDGACVTADGRLAGSAISMPESVRNAVERMGVPLDEALRMASAYPAAMVGLADRAGELGPGRPADVVILGERLEPVGVVQRGRWVRREL